MEEQLPPHDILYETLAPLADAGADTPPPPPSSSSSDYEPCVVYRNHISIPLPQSSTSDSAAPDFFSLDSDGLQDDNQPPVLPPSLPSNGVALTSTPQSARALEGTWFSADSHLKSPMVRLHKEILEFCDFLSPTHEEQEFRNVAVESVFDVIKYIWPGSEPEVFGSFKTGLYLPSSDIDLVILGSNVKSPQLGLHALSRALSQKGIAKKIQVIAKARVPIIKFVEKKSGISFDISFDVDNGPKAATFIKDAVLKWPALRPLCLILKIFLQQRELNEVYTGGIGSYALLSMLIALLRSQRDQVPPEYNLGVLLMKFFDMYGCKLNTTDVGVSCNGRGIFFTKSDKGFIVDGRPSLLAIEDPQTPDNDIGKNSFNYFQARSAFAMAFRTLTDAKSILGLSSNKSILSCIIRPDAVLVERKGGSSVKASSKKRGPDSGKSLHQLHDNQHKVNSNWPVNDEEEPLPRGNNNRKSSGKKRKASKGSKLGKRAKEDNTKENGWAKETRKWNGNGSSQYHRHWHS